MAELDSSIISAAGDIPAAGQRAEMNQQTIDSNAIAVKEQHADFNDQKKLSGIMRTLDPNSPTYEQDLFSSAAKSGVGAKELLQLKQNVYTQKGMLLEQEAKKVNINQTVQKMQDDQFTQYEKRVDSLNGSLGTIVGQYEGASSAQRKDPNFLGTLQTQRNLEYKQQVDSQRGFAIDKLVAGNKLPSTIKDMDEDKQIEVLHQLAQKGDPDARNFLKDAAKWQQLSKTPFSIEQVRSQFEGSTTGKEAAAARRADAMAKAAIENHLVPVVRPDPNDPSKTVTVYERASDAAGDKVGAKPGAGGAGSPVTMSSRASDIQDAFAINGVKLPAGVTPYGKDKAKFWESLATNDKYKDMTPEEIAKKARGGALDVAAATKETQVAAGRAAAVAGSVASIFGPNGEADTIMETAKDAGLSDAKMLNEARKVGASFWNSPKYSSYVNANKELVSSMASVFSRGGASSVHAQEEAQGMFPLNTTIDELKGRLATSRKIAIAVENGNELVIKSIQEGKSLSEIIEAAGKKSEGSGGGDNKRPPLDSFAGK